jgi:hypothetical protein
MHFFICPGSACYGDRVWVCVKAGEGDTLRSLLDSLSKWSGPDKFSATVAKDGNIDCILSWEYPSENLASIRIKLVEAGYTEITDQKEMIQIFENHPYPF